MANHVYWNWEGDIKPGKLQEFKKLATRWTEIASKDPETLFSDWTISESGNHVRIDQHFENSAAGMAQYRVNHCWSELEDFLVPTSMTVCGDFKDDLEWLRGHGAVFMKPLL
jgi:hypothetical protein